MKSLLTLFILGVVLIYHQVKCTDDSHLLGRPDGHEPGVPKDMPDESDDSDESASDTDTDEYEEYVDPDGDGDVEDTNYEIPNTDTWHDDEDYDDDDSEVDNDDGETPLIRCKRPLCLMYCANGFETDASGCPTCTCKQSNSTLIGRPDGHERPTVNCGDRPMCAMYCARGFKTGSDGCPVCECNTADDGSLIGRPDGHEPAVNCGDRPMCRMFCQFGFQTGSDGCPVCHCLENPCQGVKCETGSECQSQPCDNIRSCTRLSAKCVSVPRTLPCPEPMCANACPNGYQKNSAGCMTCTCATVSGERICGVLTCDDGQICRNKTDGSPAACSIKTLCEIQSEKPVALGSVALKCEANGSFKPMQCNPAKAECWCVDGLGQEVAGSRSTVYIDEHKPQCVRNITVSMHIHMTLVIQHDVDINNQLGSLNSTIVDHVSSWLLIEPHYIKIAKAERSSRDKTSDGDTADNNDDEYSDYYNDDTASSSSVLVVELIVYHDGQSDLPSAADYMQRRMHKGLCDIPVGSGSLLPNPYSMKTEHQFAHEPRPVEIIGEPDRCEIDTRSWYCLRRVRYAICAVGTVIFTLIVVTLGSSLYRRRRIRMAQFGHRKLSNQISVEKNFLADESENREPVGHDNYETKKKKVPTATLR